MPVISTFFGIVIRMFYHDTIRPICMLNTRGKNALLDFSGNILRGDLESKTALRLVREWIDFRQTELSEDWELAQAGKEIKKIEPLK